MVIKFDLQRIVKDASLNTLSWEIVEARGYHAGDVAGLWALALQMGESAAIAYVMGVDYLASSMMADGSSDLTSIGETYLMVSRYMARDAREIVKFLIARKFDFPGEYVGTFPGDDGGIDLTALY